MSPLRPEDVLILFVELQKQIVGSSRTNSEEAIRRSVAVLLQGAQQLKIPAIAVGVPLVPNAELEMIDELKALPSFTRTTVSAFDDPSIVKSIESSGRRTIALAGVSSEVGVLQTALSARTSRYEVHVLADACGGLSERSEQAAFEQMQAAGIVRSSVAIVLGSLVSDMTTAEGQGVFGALAGLWS